MSITILGASGRTGIALVSQALDAGHQVTAAVRTPAAFPLRHPDLTVVTVDVRDSEELAKAFVGQDAVFSTLGSTKSHDALIATSTKALVTAATETGVSRVVVLSSFLAAANYRANLLGKLLGGMFKGMVADKTAGERLLAASDLDWTVVHAAGLDKAPAGAPIRVVGPGQNVSMSNGIARADVARFMLAELTPAAHPRVAVTITTK